MAEPELREAAAELLAPLRSADVQSRARQYERERGHQCVALVVAQRVEESPDRLGSVGASKELDLIGRWRLVRHSGPSTGSDASS